MIWSYFELDLPRFQARYLQISQFPCELRLLEKKQTFIARISIHNSSLALFDLKFTRCLIRLSGDINFEQKRETCTVSLFPLSSLLTLLITLPISSRTVFQFYFSFPL